MFVDRDLYVFVYGPDRRVAAHGADAAYVGNDIAGYADVDGKPFAVEIFERATADGVWVDYRWLDPLTGEVQPKSSWVVLHDGYVFCSGIYTE
jgi:signal transduction histidine kinase